MISRSGDTLQVEGAVTVDTVPALVGAIAEHLQQGAKSVDFSRVAEVDSAAVALALEWQRQAAASSILLALVNVPEAMKNLANLYGVAELMEPEKA